MVRGGKAAALAVVLISASLFLNVSYTHRASALDLLQPVTSILDKLLAPSAPPVSQDASKHHPSAPSPAQNTTTPSESSQSVQAPTQAPATSPAPSSQTGTQYTPITPELQPVVLGTEVEKPMSEETVSTPPAHLTGSVSQSESTPASPEVCGKFFGACWYWLLSVIPLAAVVGYVGFRSRSWLYSH